MKRLKSENIDITFISQQKIDHHNKMLVKKQTVVNGWVIQIMSPAQDPLTNNDSYIRFVQRKSVLTRQESKFEVKKKMRATTGWFVRLIKWLQYLYFILKNICIGNLKTFLKDQRRLVFKPCEFENQLFQRMIF